MSSSWNDFVGKNVVAIPTTPVLVLAEGEGGQPSFLVDEKTSGPKLVGLIIGKLVSIAAGRVLLEYRAEIQGETHVQMINLPEASVTIQRAQKQAIKLVG